MAPPAVLLLALAAAAGFYLARSPAGPLRIAVLPFDTVGLTAEDSAKVEGLFDGLLTRLGGIQPDRLRVIGRRSVLSFRNQTRPLREIGERLDVAYIAEATVRREETGSGLPPGLRKRRSDDSGPDGTGCRRRCL
jgi:TolB-like protein